jgi:hypothetical protein
MSEETAVAAINDVTLTGNEAEGAPVVAVSQDKLEANTLPNLFKLSIDGADVEVDLEELKKGYASTKSAQAKFREAAQARNEAAAALNMLKENPREVLTKLGLNPREVAEAMLTYELEELTMDPKDKELRELKARFAQQQEAEQAAKKEYEERIQQEQVNKHLESITNEMAEVLQEHGFEPSPYSAERFRYYMQAALDQGIVVTPRQCSEFVIKDITSEIRSMTGGKDYAKLVAILGEDVVKQVLQASVQNTKKETPVPKAVNAAKFEDNVTKSIKRITPREWAKQKFR